MHWWPTSTVADLIEGWRNSSYIADAEADFAYGVVSDGVFAENFAEILRKIGRTLQKHA